MDIIIFFAFIMTFFAGASVGSFVNVLADRLPRRQSILLSRSFCGHCKKTLGFLELIPVFSYLMLGGRCMRCKSRIPKRLVLVEIIIGLSYSALFFLFVLGSLDIKNSIYLGLILPILIGIFFSDLEFGIIPDELVIAFAGIVLIYLVLYTPNLIANHFLSGLGFFLLFLLIFKFTKGRGMGFGDVKLSFAQGLFLGFPNVLVSLYLAFLTGGIVSIILIVLGKKKFRGDTIPFGPFLIVSTLITYLFGNLIISRVMEIAGI